MSGVGPRVACEWGPRAAAHVPAAVAVVVDVLSFTTAVTMAVEAGASVYPCAHDAERARVLARSLGAACAGSRGAGGLSLSPASMRAARGRMVLPSPNGAVVTLAQTAPVVLAGCLRNAGAVAAAARAAGGHVLIVPAGERWPDGSLRCAAEDLLGAGAIASALGGAPSPEAAAARAAFERCREAGLREALMASRSGQELAARGYAGDVEVAAELDASDTVPWLHRDGDDFFFTTAASVP